MVKFGLGDGDDQFLDLEEESPDSLIVNEELEDTFEFRQPANVYFGEAPKVTAGRAVPEEIDYVVLTKDGSDTPRNIRKEEDLAKSGPLNEQFSVTNALETSPRSLHDERAWSASSPSDSNAVQRLATDWTGQLLLASQRYRALRNRAYKASSSFARHGESRATYSQKLRYNNEQLDSDLFGQLAESAHKSSGTHGTYQLGEAQSGNVSSHVFRFRWTKDNRIIAPASSRGDRISLNSYFCRGRLSPSLLYCLDHQSQQTIVRADTDGLPLAQPSIKVQAGAFLNDNMAQFDKSLWTLAHHLFDQMQSKSGQMLSKHQTAMLRKQGVTLWLETAVGGTDKRDELQTRNPPRRIFALLTRHQIEEACNLALSSGDFRLATLIPLAGGDDHVRADLSQQLMYWRDTEELTHIDKSYRDLYFLLAGEFRKSASTKFSTASGPQECVHSMFHGLDWKRIFGLSLWYGTSHTSTVEEAFSQYEFDLRSSESSLHEPLCCDFSSTPGRDAHYHLLRLFADRASNTAQLFGTQSIDASPFEFHNTWLFYILLYSKSTVPTESDFPLATFNTVSELFAIQLEQSGHWIWAIYVLLHIQSGVTYACIPSLSLRLKFGRREMEIKERLARNVPLVDGGWRTLLLETLKLPKLWIYEAQALRARYEKDFVSEIIFLTEAGLWAEAHATLLVNVAPQAIISGKIHELQKVLLYFTSPDGINHWRCGGQLYMDAVSLMLEPAQRSSATVTKLQAASRLALTLPDMIVNTFEQRVAKAEIGKVVITLLLQTKSPMEAITLGLKIKCLSRSALNSAMLQQFPEYTQIV